jgi:hypothetical protein
MATTVLIFVPKADIRELICREKKDRLAAVSPKFRTAA